MSEESTARREVSPRPAGLQAVSCAPHGARRERDFGGVVKHDWSTYRNPAHELGVTAGRAAGQLTKAADRFLKAFRLTTAQFNFLAVLRSETGGIPQSRIGERLGGRPGGGPGGRGRPQGRGPGVGRRLKARGLARRGGDAADERVKRVVLTPQGARLMDEIAEDYFRE